MGDLFMGIFTDTYHFLKDRLENTFDKDDEIVGRQMSKILENEIDRENFYDAVEELENTDTETVELTLTNGQKMDIVMK